MKGSAALRAAEAAQHLRGRREQGTELGHASWLRSIFNGHAFGHGPSLSLSAAHSVALDRLEGGAGAAGGAAAAVGSGDGRWAVGEHGEDIDETIGQQLLQRGLRHRRGTSLARSSTLRWPSTRIKAPRNRGGKPVARGSRSRPAPWPSCGKWWSSRVRFNRQQRYVAVSSCAARVARGKAQCSEQGRTAPYSFAPSPPRPPCAKAQR